MDKKYGYDWKESTTKKEKFLEKLESVIQSVYNVTINQMVKYRKRRIWVHIDPYDTWNMDGTLAHIILPMLKQLKDTKHGAPYVDDEDVPEELRSTAAEPKENEWDTDSNHFKRWDWVMDEMIYAFTMNISAASDDEDQDWHTQIYSREPKGWNDEKLAEARVIQKRISNGYRLFGKYYQGLWD
jgi:hypothetical protein